MAWFPPADSVMAATKLVPISLLEHQKNNFQHKLIPGKEEGLKDLYACKSQRYSYSLAAENSQYSSGHGGSCLGGMQNTSQTKTPPSKSLVRWKEGVDRAYPLKPIVHQQRMSVPVVNTAQLGSAPYVEEAPNSSPSSVSKGRYQPAAVLSPWPVEPKQAASPCRGNLAYIQKLEADGRKLEKKIQKQEALLREKLKRTKEKLRRIQREKELAGAGERRYPEVERTHKQMTTRLPEEKIFRAAVRTDDGVLHGAQSADAAIPKPDTTLCPQELAMRKHKKERLVVSNSKIQRHVPMEHLASCSKPAPKCISSPSAMSDQVSVDHPSTKVLCMQADSALEQGKLGQCSVCGRNFLCTRLEKHISICSKIQGSRRKVFDSSKARAKGTELEEYQQLKGSEGPESKPPRKNNRKQKHAVLIQTMREASEVQQVLSKGGKVSEVPLLPPIKNPDYVACPYCKRQFAPQVAERHVPKCKTIKNRPPPPPQRRCC
ncbi:zinc finger C2HC domain-containing protein 1C [Strigops habroptila]|uniref:Zinc finger C2HC-type containing 1C n=1 Tax=Strigops habroptila TaxID=2489341 RepID=A0A672TKT5_STRHB|nr:zinc finger C2HC domain-containing protein 1C [Strigops habroptila]XP_030337074.1 zinc finger C2HC domain-containing protein 1C [Strigops habroptila]